MPTSRICGQCAVCHKSFKKGDTAIFFGHVFVVKDKMEPGHVKCLHSPISSMEVSHLKDEERCVICKPCWLNIRSTYIPCDKRGDEQCDHHLEAILDDTDLVGSND